jgi:hypothetical protein
MPFSGTDLDPICTISLKDALKRGANPRPGGAQEKEKLMKAGGFFCVEPWRTHFKSS